MLDRMAKPSLPSRSLLLERLEYCYETGNLYWKRPSVGDYRTQVGDLFGSPKKVGTYDHKMIVGKFLGRSYRAQRLIWKMVRKKDPKDMVVWHKNRDTLDNRIANLMLVTRAEMNLLNEQKSTEKSPYKGVYWCERLKMWQAYGQKNGKRLYVGIFARSRDAYNAGLLYTIRFSRPEIASLLRDRLC